MFFTTSWDDGNKMDMQVAKLLKELSLKGTFYIPIKWERKSLSDSNIKKLSKRFEIGSHSFFHTRLPFLNVRNLEFEVSESKKELERITKKRVVSFAYPFGLHNKRTAFFLKKANYKFARTTIERNFSVPKNPLVANISLSISNTFASPFQIIQRIPNYGTFASFRIFKKIVDNAKKGAVMHIAGHSWEFSNKEAFDGLASILEYISKKEITPITNFEILKIS